LLRPPYAWIDRDEAGHYRFREALLGEIAQRHLSKKRRELLEGRTIAALRGHFDELRGTGSWVELTEDNLHRARWLVALTDAEADCRPADAAALTLAARADADAHRPAMAAQRLQSRDWQFALDPDHPDTMITRGNLAAWLGKAGRVDEAVTRFEELLSDQMRVLGRDHADTLTARSDVAYWLGEAGRVDEAVTRFEELRTDRMRVLGPGHPNILITRNSLAYWLAEAGRVDEAVTRFEELLTDRMRVLGPDHPNTLTTRTNLAHWLGEAGRVDKAVTRFEELLTDLMRVLGPGHPTFSSRVTTSPIGSVRRARDLGFSTCSRPGISPLATACSQLIGVAFGEPDQRRLVIIHASVAPDEMTSQAGPRAVPSAGMRRPGLR
jgi:tetratricopeptide (TPR) repeat protein